MSGLTVRFGSRKTRLSDRLSERLPDSLVLDPEYIRFALRYLVPESATGEFQDLSIWRSITLHALREVVRLYRRTVIVPMTLVNPEYVTEIIGGLERSGEDLLHLFLDIDADTLRSRIAAQILYEDADRDQEARAWKLARVDGCLAARDAMPPGTHVLHSGNLEPKALADEVMSLVAATDR